MEGAENKEESPSKENLGTKKLPKIEKSCRKKLLSFLASYVGLFVLLVLYVMGGAYLFYQRESQIEEDNKEEMMENHRRVFIS